MVSAILTTLPLATLAEGTVKQAWLTARLLARHDRRVILASPSHAYSLHEEKTIPYRNPFLRVRARTIHYYTVPNKTLALSLLLSRYKRAFLTITDALTGSWWEDPFLKPFLPLICTRLNQVIIQTHYQQDLLPSCLKKKSRILPLLLDEPPRIHAERKEKSILVMTSLREEKGVGIILDAFQYLLREDASFTLTLANSGFKNASPRILTQLTRLQEAYPDRIILRGRINPYEELARHDVYAYPYPTLRGNFATPLSAYEAIQMNTRFLLPDHPPLREAFPAAFLATPEPHAVAEALIRLSREKPVLPPLPRQEEVREILLSLHEVSV